MKIDVRKRLFYVFQKSEGCMPIQEKAAFFFKTGNERMKIKDRLSRPVDTANETHGKIFKFKIAIS